MRRLMLLVILLLPFSIQAKNWENLHTDFDKFISYYYDSDSIIRQDDGHLRVWVKEENLLIKAACESRDKGACKKEKNSLACEKEVERLCPDGKIENYSKLKLHEVTRTGQMRFLSIENKDTPGEWFYVRPGSLSELIEKAVCKK